MLVPRGDTTRQWQLLKSSLADSMWLSQALLASCWEDFAPSRGKRRNMVKSGNAMS